MTIASITPCAGAQAAPATLAGEANIRLKGVKRMKKLQNSFMLIFLSFYLLSCASTQNINLIKKEAEQGNKQSQYRLAIYYEQNNNMKKAFKLYQKSANQNYPMAQNELANCYMEGKGMKKDYKKAFYWYKKASDNNYFDAINNLGYMYDLGLGVKEDNKKAIKLYEDASSKGSIRAMYNVGFLYKNGNGTKKDIIQAYKWFELARYYTTNSKDMRLKWAIRKQWDNLNATMKKEEIKKAKDLAFAWSKNINNQ